MESLTLADLLGHGHAEVGTLAKNYAYRSRSPGYLKAGQQSCVDNLWSRVPSDWPRDTGGRHRIALQVCSIPAHANVTVAVVDGGDVAAASPAGVAFAVKCHLVDAPQISDRISPKFEDLLCGHVALIRKFHHSFPIQRLRTCSASMFTITRQGLAVVSAPACFQCECSESIFSHTRKPSPASQTFVLEPKRAAHLAYWGRRYHAPPRVT